MVNISKASITSLSSSISNSLNKIRVETAYTAKSLGKYMHFAAMLSSLLFLSSCMSVYSSNFQCGDSKGLGCKMMSEVDQQIASGEIEQIYLSRRCKSGKCPEHNNRPALKLQKEHKVQTFPETVEDEVNVQGNTVILK